MGANVKRWMMMLCILFSFSISWAETYKWVDEKGTVHFTQDFNSIPERFRNLAEIKNDKTDDSEMKADKPYKKDSKGQSKEKAKEQVKEQHTRSKEKKQSMDISEIESEVTDTFTTIISLWKAGKFEALYEYGTLSNKANMAKETFVSRMGNKTWGLASSWETIRDIDIKGDIKQPTSAYASARIGYRPKIGGDTIFRTETYRFILENGTWRIDLSKILKAVK